MSWHSWSHSVVSTDTQTLQEYSDQDSQLPQAPGRYEKVMLPVEADRKGQPSCGMATWKGHRSCKNICVLPRRPLRSCCAHLEGHLGQVAEGLGRGEE